ncbi:peptide/nickel transport system permease protein [Microterricola gilva]|uniref:Peptide/nickel transport system permease protein n=1 Tax=Microterricola gilva TaxID=393267 RepID=A0A4Q8ALE7_9MICO|nr:ABC transporter permease [Microterricola gilva]RZU64871.1 peptide/nickel transport system permease protein [Microterricola gilva]
MTTPTMAVKVLSAPRIRRGNLTFNLSVAVVAVMTIAAIFAPFVAPYDPDLVNLAAVYSGPSPAHWLGTDALGRDLLSRTIFGARTALLGPLLVVISSTIIGILLGLLAAWRGGWLDGVLARIFDLVFAFPSLLLAILAVALFGKGLVAPVIAMSIAYAPFVARLTRSLVMAERSRPYVSAYRVQGFSGPWIALRRVLPNVTPIVGAQSTLNFGYVLAELAALSFLGLGVQAPTADWGAMINEAQGGIIGGHFLPAMVPAVAVVLVVVAVNVIGEELSDRIGGGVPA